MAAFQCSPELEAEFLLVEETGNFDQLQALCAQQDSTLASVRNQAEFEFIRDNVQGTQEVISFFLGIVRSESVPDATNLQSSFEFLDEFPDLVFLGQEDSFPWQSGQPDFGGGDDNQRCVLWDVSFFAGESNTFNDVPCGLDTVQAGLCRRDCQKVEIPSNVVNENLALVVLAIILGLALSAFSALLRRETKQRDELLAAGTPATL